MSEWDFDAFGSAYIILIMLLSELRLWTESSFCVSFWVSEWLCVPLLRSAQLPRDASVRPDGRRTRLDRRSEPAAPRKVEVAHVVQETHEAWAAQEDEGWLSTTTWCWWEDYAKSRGETGATTRLRMYPTRIKTTLDEEKYDPTFLINHLKSQICYKNQKYQTYETVEKVLLQI